MQDWGLAQDDTKERTSAMRWNTNLNEDIQEFQTRIINLHGSFTRRLFLMYLHQTSNDVGHIRHAFIHSQLPSMCTVREMYRRSPSKPPNAYWLALLERSLRANRSVADIRTPDPRYFASKEAHRDVFDTGQPGQMVGPLNAVSTKALEDVFNLYKNVAEEQRSASGVMHTYSTLAQFISCVWTKVMPTRGRVDDLKSVAKTYARMYQKEILDLDDDDDDNRMPPPAAPDGISLTTLADQRTADVRNMMFFKMPQSSASLLRRRRRRRTPRPIIPDDPADRVGDQEAVIGEDLKEQIRKLMMRRCRGVRGCGCMQPLIDFETEAERRAVGGNRTRRVDIVLALPRHAVVATNDNNDDEKNPVTHRAVQLRTLADSERVNLRQMLDACDERTVVEEIPHGEFTCLRNFMRNFLDRKDARSQLRIRSVLDFTVSPNTTDPDTVCRSTDAVHVVFYGKPNEARFLLSVEEPTIVTSANVTSPTGACPGEVTTT
mmetsp:Transcript_11317/g.18323  ORF Transcript_11317/g.18323 Transcript_11317/m.18323 type:complete len:490 (+) Transcript_11317:8372-9841(+)